MNYTLYDFFSFSFHYCPLIVEEGEEHPLESKTYSFTF